MGFLLIGNPADIDLRMMLEQILAPMGQLQTVARLQFVDSTAIGGFEAVLIDSSAIHDFAPLAKWLQQRWPKLPVIVLGALPSWVQAREAFRAGAIDYVLKSPRADLLGVEIYNALDKAFSSLL